VQDLPPADALTYLDEVGDGLDEVGDGIVTCVYAVYDPAEQALCLANAGHLPPLLLGAQRVELLTQGGPPPGAGGSPYDQSEVEFPVGSTLVRYAEGPVESRTADLDVGITRLIEALTPVPGRVTDIPRLGHPTARPGRGTRRRRGPRRGATGP